MSNSNPLGKSTVEEKRKSSKHKVKRSNSHKKENSFIVNHTKKSKVNDFS